MVKCWNAVNTNIRTSGSFLLPFPKRQFLDSSKLKELAEDNFKFDENGRKFFKLVENTVEKEKSLLATNNFSFSHSVFEKLALQHVQTRACLGKC